MSLLFLKNGRLCKKGSELQNYIRVDIFVLVLITLHGMDLCIFFPTALSSGSEDLFTSTLCSQILRKVQNDRYFRLQRTKLFFHFYYTSSLPSKPILIISLRNSHLPFFPAPQHILSSVLPPERIVFTYDNARKA